MKITEIENRLGKSLETIDISDVRKMMADNEMLLALNDFDTGLAVCKKVLDENTDEDVRSEFAPLFYHHQFYNSQAVLATIFSEYNKNHDKDKLKKSLDDFLLNEPPLGKINGYLTILDSVEDYEIQLEDIQATTKKVEDILFSLQFEKGFPIICDIIDSIYTLQQEYYKKYNYDLIAEDADKLNDLIARLDKFTQPIYDKMQKDIEQELPEGATAEDIGRVDMPKFKDTKEKEE